MTNWDASDQAVIEECRELIVETAELLDLKVQKLQESSQTRMHWSIVRQLRDALTDAKNSILSDIRNYPPS